MSYQDVKDKLYHGHRKIANNTYLKCFDVKEEGDGALIEMRLHGNLVARFYPDRLELYSAGWHTTTTKARLNLALSIAGIHNTYRAGLVSWKNIYQVDHQWHYGNYHKYDPKFYDGIRIDYTGKVLT